MGLFTKDIKTMNELFLPQLQDIIMPKAAGEGAPKMAEKHRQAASSRFLTLSTRPRRMFSGSSKVVPDARRLSEGRRLPAIVASSKAAD